MYLIGAFVLYTFAFFPAEPNIECTVIKVINTQSAFGHNKFPELYQSINNNPTLSKLVIGKEEFPKVDPVSVAKTSTYEKILIVTGRDKMELELKGKPISRHGIMKLNTQLAAEVTCH